MEFAKGGLKMGLAHTWLYLTTGGQLPETAGDPFWLLFMLVALLVIARIFMPVVVPEETTNK